MDLFETLSNALRPDETYITQLPSGIEKFAYEKFKEEMEGLYYPDLIVLPLTPEGEERREYLYEYHHDSNGKMIHQSIHRYGAYEYNFKYEGDIYLAIIVNND